MSHKITPEEIEVQRLIDTKDDESDELLGKQLVEVLGLKVDKKTKLIKTTWGTKTYIGLTRSVRTILDGKA